jgi:hypothetical protein
MTNGFMTVVFLESIDKKTKNEILKNISLNYGISVNAAYLEVTHDESENLLDYVTGPERLATSLMMKRFKLGEN